MQYNKLEAIASRLGGTSISEPHLLMTLRPVLVALGLVAPLWLGGCADTAPSERGFKPFASLMRSDDQTLTKAEQKAAITELQNDKKQQTQQATGEGAVVPAKTAQ
jgi:hypothetical protein